MRIEDRYEFYIDRSGGDDACHLWTGGRNPKGYGRMVVGSRRDGTKRVVLAHRWGYEHYVGPIPDGLSVCHTCDNPACQNPRHWFVGTTADNNADKQAKGRQPRGEAWHASKVTEQVVRQIREKCAAGSRQADVAARFGITQSAVSRIVNRKVWDHV